MCQPGQQLTYSHWGYQDLFRNNYPKVKFDPAPNLTYADPGGRIITAGGTTSWHDLALHLIARFASPGEESLEVALMTEEEIPWPDLAFRVVSETLRLYFSDVNKGAIQTHYGDIIKTGEQDFRVEYF